MTDGARADELRRRVVEAVGVTYDVGEEIGRGGMAVVYRARDRRLKRPVALKVLPPDLAFRSDVRSRFVREAELAAQLAHPNIVPIYSVDDTAGVVWFAMGLVEGESLAALLARDAHPEVPLVRRILRDVASGLAYAHEHGVIHRDIKPDNILVESASGRAVVTDFGIARAAEGDLRLTATGAAVGTPAYMSPEQAMGEKDVDGRADVYALGVVGWQMLAGELPFHSENTPGMLMKHISEAPRPLPEVRPGLPANLVYAIERAMSKSRDDRWADAAAFRDALDESAVAASPGSIHGAGQGPSANKPWRFDPMRDPALATGPGAVAVRQWREERRAWRDRNRQVAIAHEPLSRREERELWRATATPEERLRRVQGAIARYAMTSALLAGINFVTTPHFPWFIFAMLGMGVGVVRKIGGLWADGIPLHRLFWRQPRAARGPHDTAAPASAAGESRGERAVVRRPAPDLSGVPPEVLDSAHGAAVREAAQARLAIMDVVKRLSPADAALLPDVAEAARALEERLRALASALSQIDRDAPPAALTQLDGRIAAARASGDLGAEAERRLGLLERQRTTLRDLAGRREALARQFDNASLLLQAMKLDMLRLQSAGVESRLADSTLATQEARAVAADVRRAVEAADEVRSLHARPGG